MISNRIWVFGALLLSVAIVGLGWLLGISPKLAEIDVAIAERTSVEQQNQAHEAVIAMLKGQFAQIDETQSELDELQLSIPGTSQLGTFFDDTAALVASHGLILDNLTALEGAAYGGSVDPNAPTGGGAVQPGDGTAVDPNAPAAPVDAGLAGRFFTIGIALKVLGTADQVFALTKAMQEDERLLLITDVDFTVDGGNQSAGITGFLFVVTATPTGAI